MGYVKVFISDVVIDDLSNYKGDYWIEPDAPKDLKVVFKHYLADKHIHVVIYSSKSFQDVYPVPVVNLLFHKGKKPVNPFIFR